MWNLFNSCLLISVIYFNHMQAGEQGMATISFLISAGGTEEVLIYTVEPRDIRPLSLENKPTKEAEVNSWR